MTPTVPVLLLAYLLGSIPFGLLISRSRGIDIRTQGSGNIGATNVFRMVGKSWGLLCFFLDFCKGLAGALLIPALFLTPELAAQYPNLPLLAGAAAIMGHNFPIWLKFKGGKGIATSGGVIAAVAPWAMLSGFGTWILVMILARIVSLASILAAVAVGITGWVCYNENPVTAWVLTALAVIAFYRHRANIQRLLKGEEHRFGKKKPKL
jgi:glycerol-3-phosphate acyltransferase PlsY